MLNYYPSWVYNPREDITRENKRQYEKKYREYEKAVETAEIEKGRRLDLRERREISEKIGI